MPLSCPSCGRQLPPDARFCMHCGSRLDGRERRESSAPVLGDRNVIAGDVFGSKEDYHISGDATFIHNDDESKKVLVCAICGRHVLASEAYTCPRCERVVCANCFVSNEGACRGCAQEDSKKAEEAFTEYLRSKINGPVGSILASVLCSKARNLGIDEARAQTLINAFIADSGDTCSSLSRLERAALDDATDLLLNGKTGALSIIEPVYMVHPDDEDVLLCYLSALNEEDPQTLSSKLASFPPSSVSVIPFLVDSAIERGDRLAAETLIRDAKALYPDRVVVQACEVMLLLESAKALGGEYRKDAHELACTMDVKGAKPLERYRVMRACFLAGRVLRDASLSDELSRRIRLLSVGKDDECDFHTISEALAISSPGAILIVRPGLYEEDVVIDKAVNIEAFDLRKPVILTHKPVVVSAKALVRGIAFTNDDAVIDKGLDALVGEVRGAISESVLSFFDDEDDDDDGGEVSHIVSLTSSAVMEECLVLAKEKRKSVGIKIDPGVSAKIKDSEILACEHAVLVSGAGKDKESKAVLSLTSLVISGCVEGIGLYNTCSNVRIEDCSISKCDVVLFADKPYTNGKLELKGVRAKDCLCGITLKCQASLFECEVISCYSGFNFESGYRITAKNCVASACSTAFSISGGPVVTSQSGSSVNYDTRPGDVIISQSSVTDCNRAFSLYGGSMLLMRECKLERGNESMLRLSEGSSAKLYNCSFDDSKNSMVCVDSSNLEASMCTFNGSERYCVYSSGTSSIQMNGCHFSSSLIGFCSLDGNAKLEGCHSTACKIGFASGGGAECVLVLCSAINGTDVGYYAQDSSNMMMNNCHCNDLKTAFRACGHAKITLNGCTANKITERCLVVEGDSTLNAHSCTIKDSPYAFVLLGKSSAKIEKCVTSGVSTISFLVSTSGKVGMTSCTVRGQGNAHAFSFQGNCNAKISNCLSEGANVGYVLHDSASVDIAASQAKDCRFSFCSKDHSYLRAFTLEARSCRYGFLINDASQADLTDCVCKECTESAFKTRKEAAFSGLRLSVEDVSCTAYSLAGSGKHELICCSVRNSRGIGFLLSGSGGFLLKNCFSSNTMDGYVFIDSIVANLVNCKAEKCVDAFSAGGNAIVDADSCEADECGKRGFFADSNSKMTLSSCVASSCEDGGFVVSRLAVMKENGCEYKGARGLLFRRLIQHVD